MSRLFLCDLTFMNKQWCLEKIMAVLLFVWLFFMKGNHARFIGRFLLQFTAKPNDVVTTNYVVFF